MTNTNDQTANYLESIRGELTELIECLIKDNQHWTVDEDCDGNPCEYDTLTIGYSDTEWAYQTGDNSYSGSAYMFGNPWLVCDFYPNSDPASVAEELLSQYLNFMF